MNLERFQISISALYTYLACNIFYSYRTTAIQAQSDSLTQVETKILLDPILHSVPCNTSAKSWVFVLLNECPTRYVHITINTHLLLKIFIRLIYPEVTSS